jgi:TolB-like protein
MKTGSFFAELKRRNVVRMAGLYLVGAWFLVQVAGTVLPMFGAPEWIPRTIVILLTIGFIPALIFSWVFELTPEGIKRDEEVAPEQSIGPQTGRRMDRMIIVVLLLALGYFALDKFVLAPRSRFAHLPNDLSVSDTKSIAVLPFVNMSSDKEQEYFSDGLSEELLNQLAQIPQLRVIARTSSFSFKGKEIDVAAIAKALNVANVLEGSVRKSAKTLRVTAQLIRASDSSHLWSQTYDRDLTDVFKVQDEIAGDVVAALKVKLLPAQELPKAPRTSNPEAYQQYLQGRFYLSRFSVPDLEKARVFLERAAELDPNFPSVWAALSQVWNLHTGWSDKLTRAEFDAGVVRAREAADRALKLDPDLPEALTARFANQFYFDYDWKGGAATIKRAQALSPSDPLVLISAAQVAALFGDYTGAVDLARKAVALDPVNGQVRVYLGTALLQARRPTESRIEYGRVAELNPSTPWAYAGGGMVDLFEQKNAEALVAAEHETTEFARLVVSAVALWNLGRKEESDAALATLIKDDADVGAFQIAEVYSGRGDKDNAFLWLERARRQQDPGIAYYPNDPLLDPLRSDPRWVIFRRSVGMAADQLK